MNRPTRWFPRVLLAALAAVAIAVAACGGDDDSDDSATAVPDDIPAVDPGAEPDDADGDAEDTDDAGTNPDDESTTSTDDGSHSGDESDHTSVPSVPHDEGIDDPPVAVTDLTTIGTSQGPPQGRFEAVIETPGELCVALRTDLDDITGVHIHIGAAGETGDVFVDVTSVLQPGDREWSQGCTSVGDDIESGLADSTDALYVDVHTPDRPDGALRGQLSAATLFDLELR